MKNIVRALFIFSFLFITGFASAQNTSNLNSWIDNLNDTTPFGYKQSEKISISNISSQEITISSPWIIDELGGKIKKYTVMYSEYPLNEMLSKTDLLSQAKEKTFDFAGTENSVDMKIGLTDGLDPTKLYYILVMPKDSQGVGGEISNEIRFKLSTLLTGEGTVPTTNTTLSLSSHSAAGANMSLASISHTCNPDCQTPNNGAKTIKLSWISVPGSDSFDLFLSNDGTSNFNRIATVNMNSEKYDLQTSTNGEHVFKFTPNNGGTEYTYTVNIAGINGSQQTNVQGGTVTKVPKTGPTENTIVAILITFGAYFAYRKLFRK